MLNQKNRLAKTSDFKAVFQSGRKISSRYFGIRFLLNKADYPRLTVVVSNKVSKKSTKRNVIKRRVREIIRLHLGELKGNFDLIVNCFDTCIGRDYRKLEDDLILLFKKARII